MRNALCFLLLLCASLLVAEPMGKLFEANYDDFSQNASFGSGDLKGYDYPYADLQLNMYPGVTGKGNSLQIANSERLWYKTPGHFNAKQGTIALWMQMIDYDLGGEGALQSFCVISGNFGKGSYYYFRLLKNKNEWRNYVIGQVCIKLPEMEKPQYKQVHYYLGPNAWKAKTWHYVALTWDSSHFRLYLDGVCPTPVKYAGAPRYDNESKSIPPDVTDASMEGMNLPDMPENGRIWIGNTFQTAPKECKTAFDSFQIYDRPLTAKEIKSLYEELVPPKKTNANPHFTGIPWSDDESGATRLFLMQPMLNPTMNPHITADMWRDATKLYCSFRSCVPNRVRNVKDRDGNLWEDDSFELHLVTPEKEAYQFIVNGNGAIFDSHNKDKNWNGEGVEATVKLDESSWQACLCIPLTNFTTLDGDWLMDVSAAAIVGSKKNYWRWSNVIFDNGFGPTAQMRFLPKSKFFAPIVLGDLEHGELGLCVKASQNVSVTASYIAMNGTKETYSGNLIVNPWKITLPGGNQTLNIEAKSGDVLLYKYQADFYVDFPMEISFNTVAKEKRIDITVNFANAGGEALSKIRENGIDGTVELINPEGVVSSKTSFSSKEPQFNSSLQFPENPTQGVWRIRAKAGELERSIPYRIPDMRPYRAKVAKDEKVPEPWTPVESAGENSWRVWNRIYQFDGSTPFPKQILVGSKEAFKTAPTLELNGKTPVWQAWKVKEKRQDCVSFEGQGTIDGMRLSYNASLHFDGMYLLEWSFESSGKTALQQMKIKYDLYPEFARYAMDPDYVPWTNNRVEISLLPKTGGRKNNVLWLSGYDKGFFFWTKSNANWANKPGEAPLKAQKNQDSVAVSIDIISKPVELDGKASYTMVLQATPARPFPKNFRDVNYLSYLHFKGAHYELSGTGGASDRPRYDDPAYIFGLWPRDEKIYDNDKYAPEIRRHPYTSPGWLSDYAPDFDYWDRSDLTAPGSVLNGSKLGVKQTAYRFCYNVTEAPADLWSWWADEMMKKLKHINGLYFDLSTVSYCENEKHGCAGVDAFGQHYISNDALGMRDFFLRCYKVAHSHGYDVCIHCHTAFMPMTHFCDFFAPGENTFKLCAANFDWGYCEDVPEEQWRSDYNQYKAGVAYLFILQNGRVCDIMPSMKKFKQRALEEEELAFHSVTPLAIRDIQMFGHYVAYPFIERYWAMRGKAGLAVEATFHGYWEGKAVTSSATKVRCSWYEWTKPSPYSRVIVVGNESREEQEVNISIDWKALGIAPADLEDLWDGKVYTPESIKTLKLMGGHFTYLGIVGQPNK